MHRCGAARAAGKSLPAVVGVDLGLQGYAVVKVNKVLGRRYQASRRRRRCASEYAKAIADVETQAYYEALKRRFKVERKGARQCSRWRSERRGKLIEAFGRSAGWDRIGARRRPERRSYRLYSSALRWL